MIKCRSCGAEVPEEKAWCPQCNQPLEPEKKRAVQREMDTFAGTMLPQKKAKPAEAPAPLPAPATPAQAAKPTDPPPVMVSPGPAAEDQPTVSVSGGRSFGWVYVIIGAVVGLALLVVIAAVVLTVWFYLR